MNIVFNKKNILTVSLVVLLAILIDIVLYVNLNTNKKQVKLETKKELIKVSPVKSEIVAPKESNETVTEEINAIITLKSIYIDKDSSWILVSKASENETKILNINDTFEGFYLKRIFDNRVEFLKNKKLHFVYLNNDQIDLSNNKTSPIDKGEEIDYNNKHTTQNFKSNTNSIIIKEKKIKIKKSVFTTYLNTPSKVWDDIKIDEITKDDKIVGFKIKDISLGTIFSQIGLKRGDVIKSVNGMKLDTYKNAFVIYDKIKISDNKIITIKIVRNGQDMELNYEIK